MSSRLISKIALRLRISPVWWANFGPISLAIGKRFAPAGKPLLLVSLPRSGSSWVGATLAQANSAAYLREPMTQSSLSIRPGFTVFEVDPLTISREYRTASELAFGGIPGFGHKVIPDRLQWRLGQRNRNRVVIKEVNPLALAYWQAAFAPDIIALVRHPAAVALSLQAMGWNRDPFGRWFEASRQAELRSAIRHTRGSSWAALGASQAVIHGHICECMGRTGRIKLIRYEDICEDPSHCFRDLFAFAGFEWTERIESIIRRQTTGHDNEAQGCYSTQRNSAQMPDAWRDQIEDADFDEIRLGYLGAGGSLYGESD